MARAQNLKNLKTEKEGILILRSNVASFHVPTAEERRAVYKLLDIDYRKYSKSVDGIILKVPDLSDVQGPEDLYLVEIKTTKAKNAVNLPYGAFFGITKNEEDLFRERSNFRLCIVHTETREHYLLDFSEYESLIQNKRIQYQVNFKSK